MTKISPTKGSYHRAYGTQMTNGSMQTLLQKRKKTTQILGKNRTMKKEKEKRKKPCIR